MEQNSAPEMVSTRLNRLGLLVHAISNPFKRKHCYFYLLLSCTEEDMMAQLAVLVTVVICLVALTLLIAVQPPPSVAYRNGRKKRT